MLEQRGNLSPTERWISLLSGTGLTLAALTRGGLVGRTLGALTGLALVSRGAAGYCGMKAALTGESSLGQGMHEQWEHLRSGVTSVSPTRTIDSLEALYKAELQELHSAESQFCSVIETLPDQIANPSLKQALRGHVTELRARRDDLARMISAMGANPRQHPDQAMQALLKETRKMMQLGASNVRAAALIDSLQRIIHYKIGGYGSVAAYAQTLGRAEEASRLAGYADRDKDVDHELSSIAREVVNPLAQVQPRAEETGMAATRAH